MEREWVVVVVKEQGEERWENAELSHFASGRSAATKIKGRSSPKQRKGPVGSLPIPTVSVQDPCLPRNSAAIRGLASLFWCLYSQTRKKMATDLRLFSLGYDACRIVNTRWKFCVEEKCPAQFPPDHLLDSRTLPMSQLSEQNSKSYLIRQYLQKFALPPRRSRWRLQRNWRYATLWICKLFPGVWLCI